MQSEAVAPGKSATAQHLFFPPAACSFALILLGGGTKRRFVGGRGQHRLVGLHHDMPRSLLCSCGCHLISTCPPPTFYSPQPVLLLNSAAVSLLDYRLVVSTWLFGGHIRVLMLLLILLQFPPFTNCTTTSRINLCPLSPSYLLQYVLMQVSGDDSCPLSPHLLAAMRAYAGIG